MKRIGITGESGFIGQHLLNTIGLLPEKYTSVSFSKECFSDVSKMDAFVQQCDAIVHLAGMNRSDDPGVLFNTNIELTQKLIDACERTGSKPHILFSSSSQESKDNVYGKSKKQARMALTDWARQQNSTCTGLVIPNVFGAFGKPFYNSVVATFCHQLCNNDTPRIDVDGELKLIYVAELVKEILQCIDNASNQPEYTVPHTAVKKVSEILELLMLYRDEYLAKGNIPGLGSTFELNLFNTFRSFIDLDKHYPVLFTEHTDDRGSFTEIIRLGTGGQVSYSTTKPGITRGNHFHTRKIERFAVIKGKGRIRLRKLGSNRVHEFLLDGSKPAYVDMPIWYSHNLTNVGEEELVTMFWINECYNPSDPDTYINPI